MASLEMLWMRKANSVKVNKYITDNTPVVLRIAHVGSGSTQTPTVVLSGTSTTLTLTDGAAAVTTIDVSAAAYNTVGELADYINSLASWKCKVLDALRADLANGKMTDTSSAAVLRNGEMVFDLTSDTSALGDYKIRIAYNELVNSTRAKGSHRVILDSFSYKSDLTAAADKIQIWECDNQGKTETKIFSDTSVDTTVIQYYPGNIGTNINYFGGITATEGKELVLVVTGTVVDYGSGFLQAAFTRE